MSQPFIGPLTDPQLPAQPTFQAICINWDAFDVPRLWDIVRLEDDELGWEQVTGFRHLSDLLVDHYRRLRAQHAALAQAWQSAAAEVVLARVGAYANAILSDGHCAAATANALHTIMTTYADARTKMAPLTSEWNNVTSDWKPEWWDHAADKLNSEAREVMVNTDAVVRDHRIKITIPDIFLHSGHDPGTPLPIEEELGSGNAEGQRRVPPIPGYNPVSSWEGGAQLASLGPVPAIPGQPISMLPIPPGSQYALYGGAYILPGPGVGPSGYLVPMPPPSGRPSWNYQPGTGGATWRGQSAAWPNSMGSPASSGSSGMYPLAVGSPQPMGSQGTGVHKRTPNTVWPTEKGVPPIIEGIQEDVVIPDQPSEKQEEEFKQWFAELAYPWRTQTSGRNEPQIILRKVVE